MNNSISIKAPAISTIDQDGVMWTFDPQAQKWTAAFNGKKFQSQDYEKAREKMRSYKADIERAEKGIEKIEPPVQPRHTVEVGMLSIINDASSYQPVNLSKDKIKIKQVTVKIEWDIAKGEPSIVRYKEKEGGWSTSGASSLVLVHPSFMDARMRKFFEHSIEGRTLGNTFREAEQKIAEAWWSAKNETRVAYSLGAKGFNKDESGRYDPHSSRTALMSSQWPTSVPEVDDASFETWEAQDDGSLRRGSTTVRMAHEKEGISRGTPHFEVLIDGREDVVFKDADLRTALIMGDATHEMLSAPDRETIRTWQGGNEWTKNPDHNSWPRLMEVEWAAVMPHKDSHRSNFLPTSYVFGRFPDEVAKQRSFSSETDPQVVMWHRAEQSTYGGKSYRLAGPEDAALDHMNALRARYEAVVQENGLNSLSRDDFRDIFKSTVADVYNAAVDGEDEISKDPQTAKVAFENAIRNLSAKVNALPLIKEWELVCNEAVARAKEAVEHPSPVSGKSRKPR